VVGDQNSEKIVRKYQTHDKPNVENLRLDNNIIPSDSDRVVY